MGNTVIGYLECNYSIIGNIAFMSGFTMLTLSNTGQMSG